MMTSSNGNIFRLTGPSSCAGNSPVTGEFPSQMPVTRSFDVFFYMCLNKQLSKQLRKRWFGTPSRPLWRHCNGYVENFPASAPVTMFPLPLSPGKGSREFCIRLIHRRTMFCSPWSQWIGSQFLYRVIGIYNHELNLQYLSTGFGWFSVAPFVSLPRTRVRGCRTHTEKLDYIF